MKNTCVVRLHEGLLWFYPRNSGDTADLGSWPSKLARKFGRDGIYVIRRTAKPTSRSVRVQITGSSYGIQDDVPAYFVGPSHFGLCRRFLRELGVEPPAETEVKTFHLTVRKLKR